MSNYISEMNEQEPLGADPIPHDSTPLSSAEVRRLRRIEEAALEVCIAASIRDRLLDLSSGATVEQMQQAGSNRDAAINRLRALVSNPAHE